MIGVPSIFKLIRKAAASQTWKFIMNRWNESYENLCMSVGVMEDYKLRDLRVSHTGSVVELEHLKIKTRLTNEKFASVGVF